MEMGVVLPVRQAMIDFNFDSNCSSPYMTAPSSPQQRFNPFSLSVPTSPSRASNVAATVPFEWEEKPGTPKRRSPNRDDYGNEEDDEFAFDFSGHLDRTSLSAADELFDQGKIRPLKPPPGSFDSTTSSSRSPTLKNIFKEALSPKHKKDFDPFEAALQETRKSTESEKLKHHEQQRGRERKSNSNYVHKGSRSLSPMRVSNIILENEENSTKSSKASSSSSSSSSSGFLSIFSSASSFSKGYRKWRLKDFLLFRSASEGRATGNDAIGRYAALSKKACMEDVKNSSFQSTESGGSLRRASVSAHELHYTANRAVAEEMKKKTFLPYKQGLLGCLGFNPGMHEIPRGIGSLTRG